LTSVHLCFCCCSSAANESSAASSKANLFISPRQPGAAVTRGDGLGGKMSPPPSVSPPTGSNNAMVSICVCLCGKMQTFSVCPSVVAQDLSSLHMGMDWQARCHHHPRCRHPLAATMQW
jgi:hypothetical protein